MTDSAYRDMIREKLTSYKYMNTISGLTPDSVYSLDIESDDFSTLFNHDPVKFKENVRDVILDILSEHYIDVDVRNAFARLSIRFVGMQPIEMHNINARYENTVITFDCVISATDAPKTYVKSGVAYCPSCFTEVDVKCDFEKKIQIPVCQNTPCRKAKMILSSNKSVTDDMQTLFLQELLEKSVHSSPVLFMAKTYGKDVNVSYVGQKKRITGIFRSVIDTADNENEVYISVLSISSLEDEEEKLPSSEKEAELRQMVKKDDYIDNIVNSFAPNIYGMRDIKLSIILQLVGGVKINKRSDINIFLVGDPSMAKSELLKYAKRITRKSIYTSGRGTSGAGLTIAVVKINDKFVAQAGVLPLCDGGYAMIDEFDKMGKEDRSSMHEAMEQQTTSIAKAGIVLTLPTRTSILAAANPMNGSYDVDMSLRENVNIPSPLLSRFDLIWLIRDIVNITEDTMKADHIINSFEQTHINPHSLDEESLRGLMTLARHCKPQLTNEIKNEIIKIYNTMRSATTSDDLPVGTRQLEALVRLSYALAKLKLRDFVELEDVIQVKRLIEAMYASFNLTISSGNRQTVLSGTSKENKQHRASHIWALCEDDEHNVNLVTFMKKLVDDGFEPLEAKKLFGNWERFNQVKLNSNGTYRKT